MSPQRLSLRSLAVASLFAVGLLAGCGGDGGVFDTFQPRAATLGDFESRTFEFTWIPTSNPIDPALGPMTVSFGSFDNEGDGTFSIQRHGGGYSNGTAEFRSPNLTFKVTDTTGDTPFDVGERVTVIVEADVSDGRIRLTNPINAAEVTSDPQ